MNEIERKDLQKAFTAITLTLVLSLTLFTGCLGTGEGQGKGEKALQVSGFAYRTGEYPIDNPNYQERSSMFKTNEKVPFYFEVTGFETQNKDAWVKQVLTVVGPGEELVLNQTLLNTALETQGKDYLWFKNYITPPAPGFNPGKHQVKIKVKDKIANETVIYKDTFTVNATQVNPEI